MLGRRQNLFLFELIKTFGESIPAINVSTQVSEMLQNTTISWKGTAHPVHPNFLALLILITML